MHNKNLLLFFVIVFLSLSGCATQNGDSGKDLADTSNEILIERSSFSEGQIQHPYKLFKDYRIVPGDILDVLFNIRTDVKGNFVLSIDNVLNVKFIHNPELNEEQSIRPDGTISLPYIGTVSAIGKTVEQLTDELRNKYNSILQNPDIYIVVSEFRAHIKELKQDLHTSSRGLSRLVTVRPDGIVTFPMIGDMFVANKTIPEVNKSLNEMYEEIHPGLFVNLFLEKHSGSVIYVLGEVQTPGAIKIVKPISVTESLALAGGILPKAKLDNVVVIRKHDEKIIGTKVSIDKNLRLSSKAGLFYLQPDDIVYVPRTWVAKKAEIMRDIADIFFFRGWRIDLLD